MATENHIDTSAWAARFSAKAGGEVAANVRPSSRLVSLLLRRNGQDFHKAHFLSDSEFSALSQTAAETLLDQLGEHVLAAAQIRRVAAAV